MKDFFIELYSEEIPFGLQEMALNQMREIFDNFWKGKAEYSDIEVFVTPTRMVLHGKMLEITNEEVIEKRGPQVSVPENIINNFLKANSISLQDCYKKQIGNKEYFFFKIIKPSENVTNLMPVFVKYMIENFKWPKSMRWGLSSAKWIRPIRNIYVNFGGNFISTSCFDIPSENIIKGHKLIGSTFVPTFFNDYVKKLKENFVILSACEKHKKISDEMSLYESDMSVKILKVDSLIKEHVGINDYPTLFISEFDAKFLSLPKEILIQFLITALKVFPVFSKSGDLINKFIGVANITKTFYPKKGSTKFLNAKLSDATFFFEKDVKTSIEELNSRIKDINYYNGLGSVYDRAHRIYNISIVLKNMIGDDFKKLSDEKLEQIVSMVKMDLGSSMVFEYPELQGIVGSYIAKNNGFDNDVVLAIKEQYYPESEISDFSGNLYSIIISLADKVESLVSFFNTGVHVSGSRDPLGLRRAVNSIIFIIDKFNLSINLDNLISKSYEILGYNKNIDDCKNFVLERLYSKLYSDGNEKTLLCMILDSHNEYTIPEIIMAFNFLKSNFDKDFINSILVIYKRIYNLCCKKYTFVGCNFAEINSIKSVINCDLFKTEYENRVFNLFSAILFDEELQQNNINEFYNVLLSRVKNLVAYGNDFFDNVMINANDELVKNNRLVLVLFMRKVLDSFLNFSLLF